MVRNNIDQIGGTIDIKSVAGEGSSVTIKIPLTLAIVSALIVESAGDRFAIPQLAVIELVRERRGRSGVVYCGSRCLGVPVRSRSNSRSKRSAILEISNMRSA